MARLDIMKTHRTPAGNYYLLQGTDHTKLPAYYLIQVAATRCAIFEKAVKTLPIALDTFGTIIDSGYGQPPEDLKAKIQNGAFA